MSNSKKPELLENSESILGCFGFLFNKKSAVLIVKK